MKAFSYILMILSLNNLLYSQNSNNGKLAPKKIYQTHFTSDKITIDANFDESAWQNAPIATDFVMITPDNGKQELPENKTEVKIIYSNEAIYVAAKLFSADPTTIPRELTSRDDFATADHFGVLLNGYNDGQQDFRFYVSSSGVQQDCVYTDYNGEDFSWNAIWDSKVEITTYGWAVEMKIPLAALRFPSQNKQTWGLNLYREVRKDRQNYTWNLLDSKIGSEAVQAGIMEGIENIKTPTRLFFIPYVSQYFNANNDNKTIGQFKGGLDIKYGINDAFTLDAILVPDFGQTAFDKVELNLSPFEQRFSENRPFFTEGTELFSKGDLVYSRRIGGEASTYPETNADEEVTKYPNTVNLLNAIKVSGRTKSGLGIGVLNAITKKTYAEITNINSGEIRQEVIEPLATYNVLVLDQRFRQNSSFTLINTNVTRDGDFRDANVTGALFDFNTKANTYNLSGSHKYSQIAENGKSNAKTGYATSLYFAETSGKYRYGIGSEYYSKGFDNNDLGINYQTHYHAVYGNASYRILKANKTFNTFSAYLNPYSEFDNKTGRIQAAQINFNINSTSKKNDYYGFGLNGRPIEVYDFYEPRTADESKYLTIPRYIGTNFYFSSNFNRKFAIDLNPSISFIEEKDRINYFMYINPRYRFTNKFSLIYEFSYNLRKNNVGYIDQDDDLDEIYIGRRDYTTISNSLTGKYTLNNVMNFNLSVRHYLSYAEYVKTYTLQENGSILENSLTASDYNRNFNTWNLDLSYSWWFAPGSQLSVLYRNNAVTFDDSDTGVENSYGKNLNRLLSNQNLNHIFSLSLRYFIDYNSLKIKK